MQSSDQALKHEIESRCSSHEWTCNVARMVSGTVRRRIRIRNTVIAVTFSVLLPAGLTASGHMERAAYALLDSMVGVRHQLVIQPVTTEEVDTLIEIALNN
ncbi:MAG TPA: hypothetical protein PKE49_06620 [Leptospiraceae bacterium]|nr:hypothetical protein [Leptospirales bacterium]HMU84083.1 hypothetical protein [Leptospiraceae bacterium]HMW60232.1 hypothetical protein [Leptospiraceae bacterium]HMX56178.1 hypothetical protein [Leptospiraceae bacterium]HMY45015.1 hypothetical protein [Leptospiraceae bacterium]